MANDDDWIPAIFAAPILLSLLGSVGVGLWTGLRAELMARGVVAGPSEALIGIPGWDGAGLAGVHVVVTSCVLVTAMVVSSVVAQQRRLKTIDTEGWGS